MTYRIVIDQGLCSGFGSCAGLAPGVFALEGGLATAPVETADPRAVEAAASCPMGAIRVEELKAA